MAEVNKTNWADDDDYDSEEGQNEFGLEAAEREINDQPKKVSPLSKPQNWDGPVLTKDIILGGKIAKEKGA